jgi:His/Glu/Gln/Arg/opine family amino acid ABC transporter permease subunit
MTTYKFDFSILSNYGVYMAEGLWFTLLVALPSIVISTMLGIALAAASAAPSRTARWLSAGFVDVFRTTPVICLLFWIHYVLPILIPIRLTSTQSAIIALSLNGAAFACEAFRGGLEAIPNTQRQAAYSLGFSRRRTFWEIVVPQAFFSTLPALTNVHITIIKTVPVAVLIAVPEVMFRAQELTVQFFRPLELYTGAAVMYVALVLVFTTIMRSVERLRRWEPV